MKLKSLVRKWAEDGMLIGVAIIAIALLEYESIIRRRNEHRRLGA